MVHVLEPTAERPVGLALHDEVKVPDAARDIDGSPAGDPGSERPSGNRRLGDLRHEGVHGAVRGAAAEAGLEGPRRRREVRRGSHTRHVGIRVRQSIDRDGSAVIVVRAAEVGGVDEGGACGIELRHEDVEAGATREGGLDGARDDGEVGRAGLACHVDIRAR